MKAIKITIVTQCDDDVAITKVQSAVDAVMRSVDDTDILEDLWDCGIDGDVAVTVEEI